MFIHKKRGYNGPNLIKWVNTFNTDITPSHPNFRTQYNNNDMKKIIKFGFRYLKTINQLVIKDEFTKILYELVTKEIIRNY